MITELEQEFYDTLKIEPLRHVCYRGFDNCIDNDYNCHCHNKKPCKDSHAIYPEITAEKLLELICLINKNTKNYNKSTYFKQDYKNLKDEILENTLYCYKTNCLFNKEKEQFKHKIQQLFKD